MIQFRGRSVPTSLDELVEPRSTALLVIDVQNDVFARRGNFEKKGRSLSKGDMILRKLKMIIQEARKANVRVTYTQSGDMRDHISNSAAWLYWTMKLHEVDHPDRIPEHCLEGTWGYQIADEIKPLDNEIVIRKNRPSAFIGTNLDMILRSNGIRTVVVTGLITEGCVDSTARDALFRDYFVVVLEDCVDSVWEDLHEAALKIMRRLWFDVVSSDQVVEIWKMKRPSSTESQVAVNANHSL